MSQNIKHLFKFRDTHRDSLLHNDTNDTAAPELEPLIENARSGQHKHLISTPQLINVVNDFEWTHTPQSGRKEIPYIRLSEYSVEFSALLQNIRFMMTMTKDSIQNISEATGVSDMAHGVTKAVQLKLQDVKKNSGKTGKTVAGGILNAAEWANDKIAMIADYTFLNEGQGLPDYLKPYWGLYGTTPTGFEYTFPYFESQWKEIAPRWSEYKGGGGLLSSFVNQLFSQEGLGKEILEMSKFFPGVKGTYIERPHEYQYGQDLPSWTFTVNLLNTRDWTDVVKNWQLCYLLSYQNLPNKVTKTMLDPPVIYEVEVPGVFYSPYAYMSRVSIVNKGALRLAKVPLLKTEGLSETFANFKGSPHAGSSEITRPEWVKEKAGIKPAKSLNEIESQAIQHAMGAKTAAGANWADTGATEVMVDVMVPDAYEIQITIQSLLPESKNLLFHSILGPQARQTGIYNIAMNDPDTLLTTAAKRKLKQRQMDAAAKKIWNNLQ